MRDLFLRPARTLSLLSLIGAAGGCASGGRPEPPAAPPAVDARYFGDRPLMVPVAGVSPRDLRDSFNAPRANGRIHGAIDIPAPRGTPVVAAIDGHVVTLRQSSAGGITAYLIDETGRYFYYYAHMSHYSEKVTPGLAVKQGTVIGYVGTSGNAPPDVPHLHFQVTRRDTGQLEWWNGTPVDVLRFMKLAGKALE